MAFKVCKGLSRICTHDVDSHITSVTRRAFYQRLLIIQVHSYLKEKDLVLIALKEEQDSCLHLKVFILIDEIRRVSITVVATAKAKRRMVSMTDLVCRRSSSGRKQRRKTFFKSKHISQNLEHPPPNLAGRPTVLLLHSDNAAFICISSVGLKGALSQLLDRIIGDKEKGITLNRFRPSKILDLFSTPLACGGPKLNLYKRTIRCCLLTTVIQSVLHCVWKLLGATLRHYRVFSDILISMGLIRPKHLSSNISDIWSCKMIYIN
ncbi:hypothetical protein L345_10773, partial [Ophiophagus hannah]